MRGGMRRSVGATVMLTRVLTIVLLILGFVFPAFAAGRSTSEQIAERLAGAIRFETVSYEDTADFSGKPFDDLADYLREQFPRVHAALELERVNGYTLVFKWQGSKPDLLPAIFMSHLDVVPVEGAALENWTNPPFAGVIADGSVWGRGALDVKSGVIIWLESIETLLAEGYVPDRTIYLSLGHDEEIGGERGAAAVAELFRTRGIRAAFLFDEGGFILDGFPLLPDHPTAVVVTAEKTYHTIYLRARGVSGHSSMPPRSTAIGKLARAIVRVEENPMPARIVQPVREMLQAAAPHLPFSTRFAANNLWLTSGLVTRSFLKDRTRAPLVRTTFAATIISGGVKDNVIPELAEATINVRILPGDTPASVLEHLTRVIDDPEIEIVGKAWAPAAAPASFEGPAFKLAEAAISAVIPDVVVIPSLAAGATDSRHFADIADEILRFVPQRVSMDLVAGAHGRDERTSVEFLADSVAIAIGMVQRAGSPSSAESAD